MTIVSGFQHTPGIHCGSTALRDLLRFNGIDLSEAMCFGLGSGLGFYYFRSARNTSPSHLFFGRTATLEHDLCAHLAFDFEEGTDDDVDRAWRAAKEWIDRGVPLLLHVELSQLPYYNTRTPFPGHRVVLAGYDDARRVALLADTQFPGLQEVSYDALRASRIATIPPIPLHNEWLAIKSTPRRASTMDAVTAALRDNALGMNLDRAPHRAIMGMETLAEDFENWGDAADWAVCAKFGYQNIEVRGTGGGFFRRMYAQFLREVELIDECLRAARLAEAMEEIAGEWSEFARLLKRIAAEKDRAAFGEASRAIRRLAMREENFWGKVLDVVG
jgi:Butirosin biosynthesis protein H, N-terminal/Domain of unknown function (DUF4872)